MISKVSIIFYLHLSSLPTNKKRYELFSLEMGTILSIIVFSIRSILSGPTPNLKLLTKIDRNTNRHHLSGTKYGETVVTPLKK